jgi:hypothetical protein
MANLATLIVCAAVYIFKNLRFAGKSWCSKAS